MYFSVDSSLLPPAEETVQNKETVLKSFAYILRNAASRFVSLRVFRLENDDFACIVENTDERKAQLILEDIRQSVKLSGFFAKGTCVPAAVLSSRTIQEIPMAPAADTIYEILLQMIEIAKKKGPDGICDSFQKELLKSRKNQIVLLEPDTTYINFLLPHFKQEGYELKIYRSGKELSSAVDYFMPDLFIAEAMAPQFNGFELREKLLKIPEGQTKPFILVSLRKDEEFILRAAELGILFFLRKPFSREELFGLVDNLLR
ncbi:MAG TPA: hypothetical protein DCL73_01740 [Treponema sp.]|nr:hypothetical protein [Treponema sp.]